MAVRRRRLPRNKVRRSVVARQRAAGRYVPSPKPGAPDEADVNGDGLLCGKDVEIPAFPGFDNYVDNVLKITAD